MDSPSPLRCPDCGDASAILSHGKRYAVYPSGCMVIFGFLIAILHQASAPTDYECKNCGKKFTRRSALAKFCLVMITILILWFVAASILSVISVRE